MPTRELTIDPIHSSVEFAVTYAMNTIVKGRFSGFSGTITLDSVEPTNSSVSVEVRSGSVETGAESRDEQLRGEDFFDVEAHGALTFESTGVEIVDAHHWHVHGDLTIIGTTRPVTLDTHYYGIVEDATGSTRAGFVAETDLNRSDWGMDWNAEQDNGVLVSDRVRVSLYVSAVPAESEDDE